MLPRAFLGANCCISMSRVAEGRVLVRLLGSDHGELGCEPFRELERSFGAKPLELFFDLYAATGATVDVSGSWAVWLRRNRDRLGSVGILTGSSFVRASARTVQRFSGLGERAKLYAEPAMFVAALHGRLH